MTHSGRCGRAYSRIVINVGLLAGLVSVLFFELAIALPPSPVWHNQGLTSKCWVRACAYLSVGGVPIF